MGGEGKWKGFEWIKERISKPFTDLIKILLELIFSSPVGGFQIAINPEPFLKYFQTG